MPTTFPVATVTQIAEDSFAIKAPHNEQLDKMIQNVVLSERCRYQDPPGCWIVSKRFFGRAVALAGEFYNIVRKDLEGELV